MSKPKFYGRTLKLAAIDPTFIKSGPYSEVTNLFTRLSPEDYESLKRDIATEGLLEAIPIQDGKIIDGRARYQACMELGIEPVFKEIPSTHNPVHYCVSTNLQRRHMTLWDKIVLASRLRMLPIGRNQSSDSEALSHANICNRLNLSRGSLQRGLAILKRGTPDLIAAVAAGKVSLYVGARLAKLPPKKQNGIAKRDQDAIIEIAKGLNLLKIQEDREAKVQLTLTLNTKARLLDNSIGRFSTLLVDPPWDYLGNDGTPYSTMSLEDIKAMPVQDCTTDNAVLFLWVPSSMLPAGLEVIKAWGFEYKTCAVWDKELAHGQGAYFHQQHETLMVAIKGSMPQVDPMKRVPSVIRAKSGKHSQKPAIVYEIIEGMYPEFDKLELFSRNRRKGWTMWGNQAGENDMEPAIEDTVADLASATIESAMVAADGAVAAAVGVVAEAKAAVNTAVAAAIQAVASGNAEEGAAGAIEVPLEIETEVAITDGEPPSRFNAYGVLETPDGELSFNATAGKATAKIQYAYIDNEWLAEYRFQFHCGDFQGVTLPLSAYSKPFLSQSAALVDAATRLIEDVTGKCGACLKMPATQKKALAELVKWAESVIEANKPTPPVPPTTPVPPTKPLAGLSFVDLFAGVGGFHQGLSQQGAKCVAVVELDKPARETYIANYPGDYQVHCDIRNVVPEDLPPFDILTGGFPCQSFSIAGERLGYNDPNKGALFFEIIRIAKARQPKIMILENVEGFMNHEGGNTANTAFNELARIGYAASWRVLNASEFGVPQQRKRVFIIAIRDDIYQKAGKHYVFPTGATPSVVVADILEPASTVRCDNRTVHPISKPSTDPTRPILLGLLDGKQYQNYKVYSPLGQGTTLCAAGSQTSLYLVNGKPRRLSPRECARMQGFPETFKLHKSATQAKKQFGNSVAVPVVSAVAETIGEVVGKVDEKADAGQRCLRLVGEISVRELSH